MTTPALAPEHPAIVWFDGADAVRFLNDLISQEIADLEPGSTVKSLLLTPQGKLDHILWVYRDIHRIGLVTETGRGESLAVTLGRYRIRVEVEIAVEDRPTWVVVGRHDRDGDLTLDVSWPGLERTLVIGSRPALPEMGDEEYERLRIASRQPRFGVDVDETTIPQESGLVGEGIDFSKGCFLGQELVGRIDSRGGNVPRHLRVVQFDAEAPAPGTTASHGDKRVGSLTSVSGTLALGLLHRDVAPGDTVTAAGRVATVL